MHTRSSVRGCSLLQQPPFKNFEPTGNPYTPALIAWKPVESDLHTQSSSSNMHTRQPHCACHVTKNLVMGDQLKHYQSALCAISYDFTFGMHYRVQG